MLRENYTNVFIMLLLLFLVFGLGEFLYKRNIASYITRKVIHIGCALVAALFPIFIKLETVIAFGIGFFLLLAFSKRKKLLNSIHKMEDYSIGALIFSPSVALTALIFWPISTLIFQGSVLVLGLSDGIAGIIGKRYGKNTYRIIGVKTIEGSLTFFLITLFLLSGILYINGTLVSGKIVAVIGGSLLLTVIEAIFGKGWDNLFIAIITGVVLYLFL